MNQRYSSPLRTYPTSNWSHRFYSHLTPTQLVRMIMTASRSYSVCSRTIGPISGSFVCHLAKSVQADEASWPMSILSVFPVTREALSLTKTATSPSVLTSCRSFLADRTNCRAYASYSVVPVVRRPSVTLCIVAKRYVLEKKLLLRAYRKSYMRNRLVPKINDIDLCLEVISRSRQPLRYIRC